MQSALKLTTRVPAGKRVEFTAPELVEREDIELIVVKSESSGESDPPRAVAAGSIQAASGKLT